ncbi:MAG: peptidoglycan-binding protein [Sebaldella sp.]|nr:peptidoglycan-binding protein [Sebaldella sp.]
MKKIGLLGLFLSLTILSFSSSPSVTKQKQKTNMVQIQKSLKKLGYYHGKLDGIKGKETNRAIKAYHSNVKPIKELDTLLAQEGL